MNFKKLFISIFFVLISNANAQQNPQPSTPISPASPNNEHFNEFLKSSKGFSSNPKYQEFIQSTNARNADAKKAEMDRINKMFDMESPENKAKIAEIEREYASTQPNEPLPPEIQQQLQQQAPAPQQVPQQKKKMFGIF